MATRLIDAKAVTLPDVNMQFLPYIAFRIFNIEPRATEAIVPSFPRFAANWPPHEPKDTGRMLLMPTPQRRSRAQAEGLCKGERQRAATVRELEPAA
jgi:hypothetical protein